MEGADESLVREVSRKLAEHGINVVYGEVVKKVRHDCIVFESGNRFPCNTPVWATGAEP
jgi:NADH dehydrogenase FAD-containing subunit